MSSHLSKDEQLLGSTAIGERLPYNDYTTIDWLHDLVCGQNYLPRSLQELIPLQIKDSFRYRSLHSKKGLKFRILSAWDSCQGWVAAALIGIFTALVAFLVDVAEATISDYKLGYCTSNVFRNRGACCTQKSPLLKIAEDVGEDCSAWRSWSDEYWVAFAVYVGFALLFGIVAGSVTMTTKANLPSVKQDEGTDGAGGDQGPLVGKSMYMAAGSGIPEIKTILSGFVIPHFLDFKVLVVKAVGVSYFTTLLSQFRRPSSCETINCL
jgi:chloride channel 3/4/5